MLDDPAVVQDIVRRLRLLNPEPRPKYNPVPSKLRAPARAKEWWKKHPERRKEVVAKYEGSHPEAKQTRKARYRSRLKNAVGAFTRLQWEERKAQFGNRCAYCGRKSKLLTPDHYVPLSRGGTNLIDNIVPACRDCNRRKWSFDPSGFKFIHRAQMVLAQLIEEKKKTD